MRERVLSVAEAIGVLVALPLVGCLRLRLLTFYTGGQLLSLVPGDVGMLIRRGWYRMTLEQCGPRLTVEFGSVIHRSQARMGSNCYIGEHNRVGLVTIGDDFMSSNNVSVLSGMRPHGMARRDVPMSAQPTSTERVTIGADVWVGVGAIVGADVEAHSVIAAGAVVTKSFEEWQILGGVPAEPIGTRP